jgi:hypothetical protein
MEVIFMAGIVPVWGGVVREDRGCCWGFSITCARALKLCSPPTLLLEYELRTVIATTENNNRNRDRSFKLLPEYGKYTI